MNILVECGVSGQTFKQHDTGQFISSGRRNRNGFKMINVKKRICQALAFPDPPA